MSDERCACPPGGGVFSAECPWARVSARWPEPLGHVKSCPRTGEPCPCLPGSTAQAYCIVEARESKGE